MSVVPQIHVEPSGFDATDESTVPLTDHTQSGSLSVPYISALNNSAHLDDHVNSTHLLDEHSPQPWLGTLYITALTKSTGINRPIERELVWVQLYRKYPSVGSRLGSRNAECQSYAMFYPALLGGKRTTQTSPNPCVTPLLCLNLKHSTVVQLDPRRFSLITRSGECCSLQAEVADDADLDYWLSVFRQDGSKNKTHQLTLHSVPSERMVRSAPNSPERKRRVPPLFNNGFAIDTSRRGSIEPLNEIQEADSDE